MEKQQLHPIDMLMDEKNMDNIVLYDEDGNKQEFEQIAILPYEGDVYAILRPLDEGLAEDEAKAYLLQEVEDDINLAEVEDDELLDALFEVYQKLINQSKK